MNHTPLKIISGAQTGVDRAALDAAMAIGVPCGGWVPAGRLDEDGVIPAHYPVKELEKGGFKQRTIQNLVDADGTLIIYHHNLEDGTEETLFRCIKLHRPYHLIDAAEISPERAAARAVDFVRRRQITSLNVAGPRASKWPEGYGYALAVVRALLGKPLCEETAHQFEVLAMPRSIVGNLDAEAWKEVVARVEAREAAEKRVYMRHHNTGSE